MGALGRGWTVVAAVLAGLAGVGATIGAASPLVDEAPAVLSVNPPRDATGVATGAALDGTLAITFTEPVSLTAAALELNCERTQRHDLAVSGGGVFADVAFSFVSDRAFLPGESCFGLVRADFVSDADAEDPPDAPQYDFAWSFRVAGEPVVINELDAITPFGLGDFVELYDGGRGDTPLEGLAVVFYRGDEASVYLAVGLDGYRTDGAGYFVLGAGEVAGADLPLANDALRDGPDAVAVYDAPVSRFPRGAAVSVDGLLDAAVYGPADGRLLALLAAGQGPLDEGARGDAAADSSQRCPNGKGRPRETEAFIQNTPTPGETNNCRFDEPPRVLDVNPASGESGVAVDAAIDVDFSEAVHLSDGAMSIDCSESGRHAYTVEGGGSTYRFQPAEPFIKGETCAVTLFADRISDDDPNDPPDLLSEDVFWSFTTVRPVAERVVINEIDADTPGIDAAEFIELYDGGVGRTPLDGFVLALFNGTDDAGYYAVSLDGFATDERGYFVLGNAAVAGSGITLADGLLQNGPDAVVLAIGEVADYPSGVPVTAVDVRDAVVYSRPTQNDAGLQTLLNPGQPQIDENARGEADTHSLQRCPNGSGGPRNTEGYKANTPTPGAANDCITDTPPRVADFSPGRGATGISIHTTLAVSFDEPVSVSGNWATVKCAGTGTHTYRTSGGPAEFKLELSTPLNYSDDCTVTISGDRITDRDADDPPDTMVGRTSWAFATADPPADFIVINEIDADTVSVDIAEFIELFDGGTGSTALDGLSLVLFNGSNNLSYYSFDLDGHKTDASGYFVIGNEAIQPDLILSNGVLQNGPDAVALFAADSSQFPTGTTVTTIGLIDAVVYGDPAAVSPELLSLLATGQEAADEGERGAADAHSLQRCPNGEGGQRKTANFVANTPSVGEPSHCITDNPPTVISTSPEDGDTGVPHNSSFMVEFDEPVDLSDGAIRLSCASSGEITVEKSGGPVIYTLSPMQSLPHNDRCGVTVRASAVSDADRDDPPDTMVADYQWSFTTAAPPAENILINEVDADTPGSDTVEFVELYDGGRGNSDLTGLTLVFYNGFDDRSYYAIDLSAAKTNTGGYLVIGNKGVPGVSIEFPAGVLQNGADAVALYVGSATDFPNGTAAHTSGLEDALVYGTGDATDTGLLSLLQEGQEQVDEAGRAAAELHANGRCPNGTGGQRQTATFRQVTPSPGQLNACLIDEPPAVAVVYPQDGATGIPPGTALTIAFSEPVTLNPGWVSLTCAVSGTHSYGVTGGPIEFTLSPDPPFAWQETCVAVLHASMIADADSEDPPDHPTGDYSWSFTTAAPPPDFVRINEIDPNTPGSDTREFIELFDGGIGNTDLSGLVLVFWNGNTDTSYRAVDLNGYRTGSEGYFVVGNEGVGSAGLIIGNGALQNGADAVGLYAGRAADFSPGTPLTIAGLVDAVVYGPAATPDAGLLLLLEPGQPQVDEAGRSLAETHSLQRCPNAAGGPRQTTSYRPENPTPGSANVCTVDEAPAVVGIVPAAGATGVGRQSALKATFSEDVAVDDGWMAIDCEVSGPHLYRTEGGPRTFTVKPATAFEPGESCTVIIHAADVADVDGDDPPDHPVSDYSSTFTTADIPADFVLINEVDADTPGTDTAEFIELFDGGAGRTDLSGLVIVLWNGKTDTAYRAIDLDGKQTNAAGYFVLGSRGMPGVDLELARGALQNGPDAVALMSGDAADFPPGTALTTTGVRDAIVYGPGDMPDEGLLPLLAEGQAQVDEAGRGDPQADSLQRCPNGAGGLLRSDAIQPSGPTPGAPNACAAADESPAVAAVSPIAGAVDAAVDSLVVVEFSEDVVVEAGWYAIECDSGSRSAMATGGPRVYNLRPDTPFDTGERCVVTVRASAVHDVDSNDPPDALPADYAWEFHTVDAPPPPPPEADFTTNSPVWIGEPVVFANRSAGAGPLSFVWDFGDGGPPATEAHPTHRYAAVGEYTVTLIVTGPTGTGSRSAVVVVRPRVVFVGVVVR